MAIVNAIIVLGCIGCVGALLLFLAAKKFHVFTDPRVTVIEEILPGANCGACGCKGCRDFADTSVAQGNLDDLFCPVGGNQIMKRIAETLGCDATEGARKIATVKCAGTYQTRVPLDSRYIGPRSCALMSMTAGDYSCINGCLGCGDCVDACNFDAIKINDQTGLAEVNTDICTGCGACVETCPRHIIELRPEGPRQRRVWVACSNCSKGAQARKQCLVACLGCGLCIKQCRFDAITITNNHAYIDPEKCKTCGKCVGVCPTGAIHTYNIKLVQKNESKDV